MRKSLLVAALCLPPSLMYAQSYEGTSRSTLPTSRDPGAPSRYYDPLQSKKRAKTSGPKIETYEEYVARMKHTVKMIRKNERLMRKPQYSNPLYFGHKRPPKKNKAGKLKYCKECGIRH